MGNNCCASRNDDKESPFTEQEKRHLRALFDDLTGPKRTPGKNKLNKLTLNTLFPENPEIALLVYNVILHISKTERHINYDNFELAMEILLKDPIKCRHKDFREKEKIDVLALASVDSADSFKLSREELRALNITYTQALDFVKILLKIFHYESPTPKPVDESVAKHIVDGAFRQDEGRITWWNFVHYLKENLIYINRALKSYFAGKFLNEKTNLKLPNLNKTSFLLDTDLLAILYLSNIYMQLTPSLEFVYSSRYQGLSYPQIAQALANYHSSSYIFLKVEPYVEDESPNNLGSNYIIGGFSRLPWKDTGEYGGDNDCYLFSLTPQFQNMYALTRNTAHPNYTYLKSSFGYNQGIGFGGGKNDDFRIWIDGQDMNKSYVKNEDATYSSGALLGPGLEKMRIVEVEIWGLGIDYHNKQYLDNLLNASTLNRMSTGEGGLTNLSSNLAPYGTVENIALNKESQNVTYNQSKIADLIHESDQLSKSLTMFESKLAQNSPSLKTQQDAVNKEQYEQESVKRSSRASPYKQNGSSEDTTFRQNSYREEARFAADEMISSQRLSSSPKKMTYTELYGYHNPFKGDDQNVVIARSFTDQDLQMSPKKNNVEFVSHT